MKSLLLCVVFCCNFAFGQSWTLMNSPADKPLKKICFLDQNTGFAIGDSVVLKTDDAGANWYEIAIDNNVQFNAISVAGENTVYVATQSSIYKSADKGISWSMSFTAPAYYFQDICFTSSDKGYASSANQILKTTDGAFTWQVSARRRIGGLISFPTRETGYVIGGTWPIYISKTVDEGLSFDTINSRKHETTNVTTIQFINDSCGFICGFYGPSLLKTTDGAKTWQPIDYPGSGFAVHFLNENIAYTSYSHGSFSEIFASEDGGKTWTSDFKISRVCPETDFNYITSNSAYVYTISCDGKIYRKGNPLIVLQKDVPEFKISPNPTDGIMYINSTFSFDQFKIYNSSGELTYSKSFLDKLSVFELNLSDLPSGIYYISLLSDTKVVSRIMVIQ